MSAQIIIEGNSITGIASFYDEINRVFMASEDWKIGQSLDAFNDLLYGGYGALYQKDETEIIWNNIENSRDALGYEATRNYYLEKLKPDSPFNHKLFMKKLTALENGTGETYFDIIMEIIADHSNIKMISALKNN